MAEAWGGEFPESQLILPVALDTEGHLLTLRDVLTPGHAPILSVDDLPLEQQADLTIRRIAAQPRFELALIEGGLVDKERAIREVKDGTEIGQMLVDIELRVIRHFLKIVHDAAQ